MEDNQIQNELKLIARTSVLDKFLDKKLITITEYNKIKQELEYKYTNNN